MWLKHLQMIYRCIEVPVYALPMSVHSCLQSEQWCVKYHVLIVMISLGQFASLRDSCVESYVSAKYDI